MRTYSLLKSTLEGNTPLFNGVDLKKLLKNYTTIDKRGNYILKSNSQKLPENFGYNGEEWKSSGMFPSYVINGKRILRIQYTDYTYINNFTNPILSIDICEYYLNDTMFNKIKPFIGKDNRMKMFGTELSGILSSLSFKPIISGRFEKIK